MGRAQLDRRGRFPLLLKLLDASAMLSLQVHPGDALAQRWGMGDGGKSEAWVILQSVPGAEIVRGLRPGGRQALFAALRENRDPTPFLNTFTVASGDVIDVPAGTIHCLGPGVVLYEIQQNSDITLRLSDWGRQGDDGKPRALHVDRGELAASDAQGPNRVEAVAESPEVELLVSNEHFELRRLRSRRALPLETAEICQLVTVTRGHGVVLAGDQRVELEPGGTCLVAAAASTFRLIPQAGTIELEALFARPSVASS
jgi:mannose-6-phosphate isomerase